MFKKIDPNTFTQLFALSNAGVNQGQTIGTLALEYQVMAYDDVQIQGANSVTKPNNRKYILRCTQRVSIFNPDGLNVAPRSVMSPASMQYLNYPAMIQASAAIAANTGLSQKILEFSPKTINTKVERSGSATNSDGTSAGTSKSSTVGSSTSQSNSYGGSISWDSISANYEHSSTVTNEQSNTVGSEAGTNHSNESSSSESMSVKDWGGYALIKPDSATPWWTFAQEYPWNALATFTDGSVFQGNQVYVDISLDAIKALAPDGMFVNPPSQLSEFGISFVMKAAWEVILDNSANDTVTLDHSIGYFSASHFMNPGTTGNPVLVCLDSTPYDLTSSGNSISVNLDLPLIGLNPIGLNNINAIAAFIPNKFTIQPSQGVNFKLVAPHNNLMVVDSTTYPTTPDTGEGFSLSNNLLDVAFTPNCATPEMTMYFKVVDTTEDYIMYIKLWKTQAVGVQLTITVNGDDSTSVVKYIDDAEGLGGDNNLLSIYLRNQDFSSNNYNDLLQLGLNSIRVQITPIGGKYVANSGVQIKAISIEKQ